MKAYTDIEQSRKLAEILPFESANMVYIKHSTSSNLDWRFDDDIPPMILGNVSIDEITAETLPCWSLAALLGVLPNDTSLLYFDDAYQMVYDKKPYVISNKFDNPVDACYEMILKLYELKML